MEGHEQEGTDGQTERELLYHYTDQRGLLGILERQNIRATHDAYLNDYEERQGVRQIFAAMDRAASGNNHLSPEYWKGLRESLKLTNDAFDSYISSFTKKKNDDQSDCPGDRLSQWRGYAADRQGFSLGFQRDILEKHVKHSMGSHRLEAPLWDCIYEQGKKNDHINDLIDHYVTATLNSNESWRRAKGRNPTISDRIVDSPEFKPIFRCAQIKTLKISALFKDYGFNEENEVRLVIFLSRKDPKTHLIQFRDDPSRKIPYLEIPLGLRLNPKSPLKTIVVGPGPHRNEWVNTTALLLAKFGIRGVKVIPSKIPYRNW